jgi:hypothetical protein
MDPNLSSYIRDLQLAPGQPYKKSRTTLSVETPSAPVVTAKEQSFLAENSIVSFASSISVDARQDILNSLLLAQLAANHTVGEDKEDVIRWYQTFLDVLQKTGWIMAGKDKQTYSSKSGLYEVENVIIDILSSVFGSGYIAIIQKTLEAIKNLGKDNGRIKAFENNVNRVSKSCFQIALASESNGIVSLTIGTFVLDAVNTGNTVLFFAMQKQETTLEYISKTASYNAALNAKSRDVITARLGELILTNISEIQI